MADEIERRGHTRYGDKWPKPPTEADIEARGRELFEEYKNEEPQSRTSLGGPVPRREMSFDKFFGGAPTAENILSAKIDAGQYIRRLSVEGELQRDYHERRRPMLAPIINDLLQQVYEGAVEIIEVRDDGTSKTFPGEWAMSVSASHELEDGKTAHGQLYFKEVDSQVAHSSGKSCREPIAAPDLPSQNTSGSFGQLCQFFKSRGNLKEYQGLPKDTWKSRAKAAGIEFNDSEFKAAWKASTEMELIKPLTGNPEASKQYELERDYAGALERCYISITLSAFPPIL